MARILIVDDDAWSLRIAAETLAFRGHTILVAANIVEARTRVLEGPDLVLLDIHLPDGGGEVLLAEIRSDATMRALPVIALTASAMSGDRERLLRAGFTAYLSKPIDVRSFGDEVEPYLARGDS